MQEMKSQHLCSCAGSLILSVWIGAYLRIQDSDLHFRSSPMAYLEGLHELASFPNQRVHLTVKERRGDLQFRPQIRHAT